MDKTEAEKTDGGVGDLVPFDKWLKSIGKSRVTGWNWRKNGAVKAINVFGRIYITRGEITRFEARAGEGEFARRVQRKAPAPRDHKPKSSGFFDRLIGRKPKIEA